MSPTNTGNRLADLISESEVDRYRLSADASHFLLIPSAVATAKNAEDISRIFRHAQEQNSSVTFRSGGTSLSGQAVTSGIMVDTRKNFRAIEVLDGGERVRVQPGATVRSVNTRLARLGRKLGPDPASEIACTIGGVIANNSSGMACGITHNTYRTLESATVVLANGAIINTADSDSEVQLRQTAPDLYQSLVRIHNYIKVNPSLIEKIKSQYQIKNTMGYGLNSFVDFESIIDIFLHLLIGSEGTLGFIAEAVFKTIPLYTKAATGLFLFENLEIATLALEPLISTHPATIELMDSACLRAGKVDLSGVEVINQTALIVEYQASNDEELKKVTDSAQSILNELQMLTPPTLTTDPDERARLWKIRKEIYAIVAGARKSGTTALLEDIAVPVAKLADTCNQLGKLFTQYGYEDAVIFGHAKDGNLHFLINENFADPVSTARYQEFTESLVELVLANKGSLKAEHGTGRMMAPFVERQFGPELYAIMREVKSAFDSAGILNPGVIITENSSAHLQNIKFHPTIEKIADNCVECGYCEPVCPSKDLTTTPRQRIVLQRAIESAAKEQDHELRQKLESQSRYWIEESCAADGLCQSSCPLGINTGALVTELRSNRHSAVAQSLGEIAADRWGTATNLVGRSLSIIRSIPAHLVTTINTSLRTVIPHEYLPLWNSQIPRGGKPRTPKSSENPEFILFTSCLDSIFDSKTNVALQSLADKTGMRYAIPDQIESLCCGTPWKSKGFTDGYQAMIEKTHAALLSATDQGRIPVVCENSSCSQGLIEALKAMKGSPLQIIDSVDYVAQKILPKLEVTMTLDSILLHPTCSSTSLGSNANLQTIARAISQSITIPDDWGCCAFAGDRGLLHPKLTRSATKSEVKSIIKNKYGAYLSTNRTCEIGMSQASGQEFEHILVALDRCTSTGSGIR